MADVAQASLSVSEALLDNRPPLTPDALMDRVEVRRLRAAAGIDRALRAERGQFFTPAAVARTMASMFEPSREPVSLLDAGAGIGSLTAAFVAEMCHWQLRPRSVTVTAFELDKTLAVLLRDTLSDCVEVCAQLDVSFSFSLRQGDFLADNARYYSRGEQFSYAAPQYSHAILNPPYRKVRTASSTWRMLRGMGVETSNLYSAFLWLVSKRLDPSGQLVAITPRSFCNGPYFRRFRLDFLRILALSRIHVYESRKQAFRDDDVLQENVIISAVSTADHSGKVVVSSSAGPEDGVVTLREVDYGEITRPDDPDSVIHIVPDEISAQFREQMRALECRLADLGLAVSTGRVVDFRATQHLRSRAEAGTVPLVYPCHVREGRIVWPSHECHKPEHLLVTKEAEELVVPSLPYVLVKRFSAKEERRRITAAVFDPALVSCVSIGFENHLNYFHTGSEGMPLELARGLAGYLNSTLVDEYFRLFSGHTQVNAADLRSIKYPSRAELLAVGRRLGDRCPQQDELDRIVMEEQTNMPKDTRSIDPVQGKKRVNEARQILKALEMPGQQQNQRSALVLLALLDMKAHTAWRDATASLIGITEMMDYFERHFGVKYAPNTRETIRRQTVHQFLQAGLVVPNPDDPLRPVNSPDNRYRVDPAFLALVRTFGDASWSTKLTAFAQACDTLKNLDAQERKMSLIPVRLPNGRVVNLTGDGQNSLIKDVIDKLCSRYTPGGTVVYIGDAGNKLKGHELAYLAKLGVRIDKHGKMPDVIIHHRKRKWLFLIEAVTSHGPMSLKRHNELSAMFDGCKCGLVFVTAFPTRKEMKKHLTDIAWETEVWVAETPTHMIHFNGDRFLGPY
jgi:adenine-specific DNA-methyltransferase